MFQIFICLPIGQSLIAQILDFMLVRTSTSLQKHGILRIPRTKFEKVGTLATSQRLLDRIILKKKIHKKLRFLAWIWSWKTNNLESSTSRCWRYCHDFYRCDIIFHSKLLYYDTLFIFNFQQMVARIDLFIMSSWNMVCNINHLVLGHLIKERVSQLIFQLKD